MSSERQIAANRLNARKSRGPRTAAGKSIVCRNALRHGLTATVHRHPLPSADLEELAKALCGGDDDPSLLAQAGIIANNELVLRAISAQQLAVVERCREPTAVALAKGDNSLALAKARSRKTDQADAELQALIAELLERYKDELPPPSGDLELLPSHLLGFLGDKESEMASTAVEEQRADAVALEEHVDERDESAALEEAALDLVRLDRYEREAWSRQKRAILAFMNIKFMKGITATKGASFSAGHAE